MAHCIRTDAGSSISYLQCHVLPWNWIFAAGHFNDGGLNGQTAAGRHRIARIHNEIHQRLPRSRVSWAEVR